MSETLRDSMKELLKYAKGNTESVEVRTYNLKEVPKYSGKEIREIKDNIKIPRNAMADILGVSVRTIEK